MQGRMYLRTVEFDRGLAALGRKNPAINFGCRALSLSHSGNPVIFTRIYESMIYMYAQINAFPNQRWFLFSYDARFIPQPRFNQIQWTLIRQSRPFTFSPPEDDR